MPVFYRGKERVLFSHIPKTAGSSLYVWFYQNGWLISNLRLLEGVGTGAVFSEKFEIWQCQMEKKLPKKVSPQHSTVDVTSHWGEFTSQFCIVRHPLTRFVSELNYCFPGYCRANKIKKIDDSVIRQYVGLFVKKFLNGYRENCEIQDNHIRPQSDFISSDMHVLYFEGEWVKWLKRKYKLSGTVGDYNKSGKVISLNRHLGSEVIDMLLEFYNKDFDLLGYPADPEDTYAV